MSFSEEEVKRAAELKLWVQSRLTELQAEIQKLGEVLAVVDSVLRRTSFKSAAEVSRNGTAQPITITIQQEEAVAQEDHEVRPLRKSTDGKILANALISASSVAIAPVDDIKLNISTPPFRSFFLNRILEGMKAKDRDHVAHGKLKTEEIMDYEVEDKDGIIRKIVINNYREKDRLGEIISTATWVLSRMLEKQV